MAADPFELRFSAQRHAAGEHHRAKLEGADLQSEKAGCGGAEQHVVNFHRVATVGGQFGFQSSVLGQIDAGRAPSQLSACGVVDADDRPQAASQPLALDVHRQRLTLFSREVDPQPLLAAHRAVKRDRQRIDFRRVGFLFEPIDADQGGVRDAARRRDSDRIDAGRYRVRKRDLKRYSLRRRALGERHGGVRPGNQELCTRSELGAFHHEAVRAAKTQAANRQIVEHWRSGDRCANERHVSERHAGKRRADERHAGERHGGEDRSGDS